MGRWYKPWFHKYVEGFLAKDNKRPSTETIPTTDFCHRHNRLSSDTEAKNRVCGEKHKALIHRLWAEIAHDTSPDTALNRRMVPLP